MATPTKKRKSGPSGQTKSYADRSADSVGLMVWLSKAAAGRLEQLVAKTGSSKRAVVERLLLGTLDVVPPPTPVKREKKQPATHPVIPRSPDLAVVEAAVAERNREIALSPLSPLELAARIRASGQARRDAVVLRTGERAGDRLVPGASGDDEE